MDDGSALRAGACRRPGLLIHAGHVDGRRRRQRERAPVADVGNRVRTVRDLRVRDAQCRPPALSQQPDRQGGLGVARRGTAGQVCQPQHQAE